MKILHDYYTTILQYYDIARLRSTRNTILPTIFMREDNGGLLRHSLHAFL